MHLSFAFDHGQGEVQAKAALGVEVEGDGTVKVLAL
jgi:hypothetical protein